MSVEKGRDVWKLNTPVLLVVTSVDPGGNA